MTQWEYLTTTFEANADEHPPPVTDGLPPGPQGRYSPRSLIPQLNELGRAGWEMVSIEPIIIGKNGDVMVPDTAGHRWARHYLCCFKRSY